jgi:hypothetical protein
MHSQGAVHAGASIPEVSWGSATIPIPAALTVLQMSAINPKNTTILVCWIAIIINHRCLPGFDPVPGIE